MYWEEGGRVGMGALFIWTRENGGGSAEAWGEVKGCVEEVERAGLWKQPV